MGNSYIQPPLLLVGRVYANEGTMESAFSGPSVFTVEL
jgi:hypothetical protein